ncbi:MAG: SurA N-terminal domain-containing protein [Deltaproteobacteria bacterium]|nr:SurA N-terminal domain-containing protein [Deltaproteobacteria bacterium]
MEKKHKKWLWGSVLVLVLVLGTVLTILFWPEQNMETKAEVKIAVVNGVEITRESFNLELKPLLVEISEQENKPTDSQMLNIKKNVLEKMIVNELLYQESMKDGINVDDGTVNDRVNQLKKQYSKEAGFKKELSRLGMSEEDLKLQVRKEMTIQQYVYKKFVENMTVTNKELSDYYNKYGKERIRQNLKQAKAQKELNAYVEKLKAGAAITSFLKIEK